MSGSLQDILFLAVCTLTLYLHPNAAVLCLPAFAHTRLMESADMRAKQLLNALT